MAVSSCPGVQPTRLAVGSTAAPVAAAALAAPVLVGSPDTEASAVWIQLRSGMIARARA